MKKNMNLWIFGVLAIIVNSYGIYLLYPILMMLLQYNLAMLLGKDYFFTFYCIIALFLFVLIILIVNLYRFKKWSFYIFIGVTLVINIILWHIVAHFLLKIFLTFFLPSFLIYFLKPTTRRLFNR